jgi:hypothetical protein
LLADRQHIPVVLEGGLWRTERAAQAHSADRAQPKMLRAAIAATNVERWKTRHVRFTSVELNTAAPKWERRSFMGTWC